MRSRKRFAQYWLKSESALEQILTAAQLNERDRLLEIGPGTGILTEKLLPWVDSLLAVELDADLCKHLVKKFRELENFLLLQGDFLDLDLVEQTKQLPKFQGITKVVANIPYNITGPILTKLLGEIARPVQPGYDLIVLLVQKEVAERITATAGTRNFGALSVRVQYLADCRLVCEVPAQDFQPSPKVDSAVISLKPRPYALVAQKPQHLDWLLRLGFAAKRKMLKNNLHSLGDRNFCTDLLVSLGLNPNCRPEDLGVDAWITLSNYLVSNPSKN